MISFLNKQHFFLWLIYITYTLFGLSVSAQEHSITEKLDNLVQQWTQIEQQNNHIQNRWLTRQVQLKQQYELLLKEKKLLENSLKENQEETSQSEKKRYELLKNQNEAEAFQQELKKRLEYSTIVAKRLYLQLPPPLYEQWSKDITSLEQLDGNSQKLETLLSLLSSLEKFKQRVVFHQTNMQIDEGVEVQVYQLFLGLSHGWYVSSQGDYYGFGRSTSKGWQWKPFSESEHFDPSVLLSMIEMLKNTHKANMVSLPISQYKES